MPGVSSEDDRLPIELIDPGEVGRILEALPRVGDLPSHYLPSPGSHPTKREIYRFTMYEGNHQGMPSTVRNPDRLFPGDYVEIMWPTKESVMMCKSCKGKGWQTCPSCLQYEDVEDCPACEGTGDRACPGCEGSQGDRYGTIISIVKTADEYFVVDAIRYLDYYNEEWDRDLVTVTGTTYVCDQLAGVLELVRCPNFALEFCTLGVS